MKSFGLIVDVYSLFQITQVYGFYDECLRKWVLLNPLLMFLVYIMHKHKYYFQVGYDFTSDMDGEIGSACRNENL